ncbi:phosphotransferase [Actinacidiphila glaucinigra]|uniref:phosphotransferase n=1 Tax=Actinacidiphila glaucinigra TaxID=235986 RepID=UPI0037C59AAE
MVVRLPGTAGAASDVDKEHRWLPRLAPGLPASAPAPLGKRAPVDGCPWAWSVYGRLEGENPAVGRLAEPAALAGDLAAFVAALQRVGPAGAPPAYRGEPLAARDRAALGTDDATWARSRLGAADRADGAAALPGHPRADGVDRPARPGRAARRQGTLARDGGASYRGPPGRLPASAIPPPVPSLSVASPSPTGAAARGRADAWIATARSERRWRMWRPPSRRR